MPGINRCALGLGLGGALLVSRSALAAPPGRWIAAKPIPVGASEVIGAAVGGNGGGPATGILANEVFTPEP